MAYPTDRAGRITLRAAIREQFIAAAEQRAREAYRSLACATGTHPPSCVGAAGCICECHDPAEPKETS